MLRTTETLIATVGLLVVGLSADTAQASHLISRDLHILRCARDDDDREDAAERLGSAHGNLQVAHALAAALRGDREDDVRKDAARSLGKVGVNDDTVGQALSYAAHYDRSSKVRREAHHTLAALSSACGHCGTPTRKIQIIEQPVRYEREVIIEREPVVRREVVIERRPVVREVYLERPACRPSFSISFGSSRGRYHHHRPSLFSFFRRSRCH